MRWFYISFGSFEHGHLGSTVVQAADVAGALAEATARGLNPGGEAQIIPVPPERSEHPDLVAIRNRLANKHELMGRGATARVYHENAEVVCEECNDENKTK